MCETKFPLDNEPRLHDQSGKIIHQGLRTGAFAEYVVVDESQVVQIPKEMPLDSASLLACGVITGLGAVTNTAQVPSGSSVVVIGTGGVGLNSVQGAVLSGAHTIIALDLVDRKLEAAKAFGATHTINPAKEDAQEAVQIGDAGARGGLCLCHGGQRKGAGAGDWLAAKAGNAGHCGDARDWRQSRPGSGRYCGRGPAHPGEQDGLYPAAGRRPKIGGALPTRATQAGRADHRPLPLRRDQ